MLPPVWIFFFGISTYLFVPTPTLSVFSALLQKVDSSTKLVPRATAPDVLPRATAPDCCFFSGLTAYLCNFRMDRFPINVAGTN